jgi:predicted component of type VI protein secretion system
MATSSYLVGQKSKYRITLELNVMEDFNPHQIDWNKILDLQGNEQVNSYTEDLSRPDRW